MYRMTAFMRAHGINSNVKNKNAYCDEIKTYCDKIKEL